MKKKKIFLAISSSNQLPSMVFKLYMDSVMLVFEEWNLFPRKYIELLWKLGNKK